MAGDLRADAVIVDEGQDFDDSRFMALEGALDSPAEGLLFVFAGRHQAIYREEWEPPFDAVEYVLDLNCRNTNETAEPVGRIYGDDIPRLGASGPAPEFHAIESPEGAKLAIRCGEAFSLAAGGYGSTGSCRVSRPTMTAGPGNRRSEPPSGESVVRSFQIDSRDFQALAAILDMVADKLRRNTQRHVPNRGSVV